MYFIESHTPEDFQNHANLIKDLISVYTAFATGLARHMNIETWSICSPLSFQYLLVSFPTDGTVHCREFLQMTMLETTHTVLISTPPFSLDNVAPMVADSIFQVMTASYNKNTNFVVVW